MAMFKVFGKSSLIENRVPFALTLGNFDGVHLGHRRLLQDFIDEAHGEPTCVITFFPHPTRVFSADAPKPLILSLEERVKRLLACGVDVVVVQSFTEEFAELTATEFLETYLKAHFAISRVYFGYDFSYGKDRSGNFQHLSAFAKEEGWNVKKAPVFEVDGTIVSSTLIRQCVIKGKIEKAERLLGVPFALAGTVVHGDKRGRTIGFPTANLDVNSEILPLFGVYACLVERCKTGQLHEGVMNCGYRPTLGQDLRLQIEAHLLDFDDDLYGEKLVFHLKSFLRQELKFSSLKELKEQIAKDTLAARAALKERSQRL